MAKQQQVFVIYGRHLAAYAELKKFLTAVGVAEITFEDVANMQAAPYVTEIVIEGIHRAAAVIVLFTPDELAVLYQTGLKAGSTGDAASESRWQPRPNVLFEAGIAFAFKKDKTILVALGDAVAGFSDIGGIHLVRIDGKEGKQALRKRLQAVLKGLPQKLPNDWLLPRHSGDFQRCVPKRWRFYDELKDLETFLAAQIVIERATTKKNASAVKFHGAHSVLDIVVKTAQSTHRSWQRAKPRDFMQAIAQDFTDDATNDSYWWLVVGGFFQFQDIEVWFDDDGEDWEESVDYAAFAPRGLALLEKLGR